MGFKVMQSKSVVQRLADDEIRFRPWCRARVGVGEQRHALGFVRHFAPRHRVRFHAAPIPANERAAIAYHLERLKALGWTLAKAVDFIEKHGKAAPSLPLGTVGDDFLTAKETGGLRPRYLKTLKASIKRFMLGRRQKLISDITPAEIQEYRARTMGQTHSRRTPGFCPLAFAI